MVAGKPALDGDMLDPCKAFDARACALDGEAQDPVADGDTEGSPQQGFRRVGAAVDLDVCNAQVNGFAKTFLHGGNGSAALRRVRHYDCRQKCDEPDSEERDQAQVPPLATDEKFETAWAGDLTFYARHAACSTIQAQSAGNAMPQCAACSGRRRRRCQAGLRVHLQQDKPPWFARSVVIAEV